MTKRLLRILLLEITLFGFFQVFFFNSLSGDGAKLVSLEEKKRVFENQNWALTNEISLLSSLTHIQKEASRLGFVPVGSALEFLTPPTVALSLR